MPDVAGLEDQQDDPVDGGDEFVEREGGVMGRIDGPDFVAMVRSGEGIDGSRDEDEKPGDDGECFEGDQRFVVELGALCEGIIWDSQLDTSKGSTLSSSGWKDASRTIGSEHIQSLTAMAYGAIIRQDPYNDASSSKSSRHQDGQRIKVLPLTRQTQCSSIFEGHRGETI